MESEDKYPLHTAAREGRGELQLRSKAEIDQHLLTSTVTVAEGLLKVSVQMFTDET
jgi:hypothetical protein